MPDDYKIANVSVSLPLVEWQALLDMIDIEAHATLTDASRLKVTESKEAIRKAIEADQEVPGAQIAPRKYRLVRK